VADVTTHPAFRNAAHTVAAIYDMKADSANREIMSFTDGGEQCSMYYLRARTQEDLRRRMRAHRMIADIPNLRALWPKGSLAARRTTSRAL
jgi:4-hydroxyphenylacetate 3-monooxygenase